jgi:polygalacturonase
MTMQVSPVITVFNVRDHGASGKKDDSAQAALQATIDACGAAGGGTVYLPPGDYTTGTLHLRSDVRVYLESGATIFSSKDKSHFDKGALFFADSVHRISLEGRGVVDGQAAYQWRETDMLDYNIYANQLLARQVGVPLTRSFPTENSVGHLVLFLRCQDVRIEDLSFLHSPSWTMHLYGCERVNIDGVYIYTNQRDGVWADGIDPDGCKDVHISNCTIETGDDAIVFYSYNLYGPPLPCENITVTNCRLSSSSSALKFCDCNMAAIRNVTVDNCVITGSNRGIAFMVFDGGILENIVLSNLTIECKRFDWFWWGDGDPIHFNLIQRSELHLNADKANEPPVGVIRNVILSNIIAHGPGPSVIHGHVDSPLENITFDNVRLTVDSDPQTPWRKGPHALTIENARNFRLEDVGIAWESPTLDHWQSAIAVNNVQGLTLDNVSVKSAMAASPAIVLNGVDGAQIRNCQAQPGTDTFIAITGEATRAIVLSGNDLDNARVPFSLAPHVQSNTVRAAK